MVRLFEFDTRFSKFGDDFVFYDYKKEFGTNVKSYEKAFDIIFADPPFLSAECIEQTAKIIKKLRKENASIVMCSGKITTDCIKEQLMLDLCAFKPCHERNLANEFCAFANFEFDKLLA